jgi:hypothetical protein
MRAGQKQRGIGNVFGLAHACHGRGFFHAPLRSGVRNGASASVMMVPGSMALIRTPGTEVLRQAARHLVERGLGRTIGAEVLLRVARAVDEILTTAPPPAASMAAAAFWISVYAGTTLKASMSPTALPATLRRWGRRRPHC